MHGLSLPDKSHTGPRQVQPNKRTPPPPYTHVSMEEYREYHGLVSFIVSITCLSTLPLINGESKNTVILFLISEVSELKRSILYYAQFALLQRHPIDIPRCVSESLLFRLVDTREDL